MIAVTLASLSAARAALLTSAGVTISTVAPRVDEGALKAGLLAQGVGAREIADALAEAKAVKASARHGGLVIGADSTVAAHGRLFDKPADLQAARDQLISLRGGTHQLHSAVVVAEGGAPVWRHVATATLAMRPFSDAFLDHYLAEEGAALLATVGCYRLEGLGGQLFSRIDGDYFAILGLPLLPVLDYLRLRGALQA